VRWALEHIKLDNARLKQLGAEGFMPPTVISCADHEGSGMIKFQQWERQAVEIDLRLDHARKRAGARESRGLLDRLRQGKGHSPAGLFQGKLNPGIAA